MTRGHFALMLLTAVVLVSCAAGLLFVPILRLPCGHKESVYAHYYPRKDGMRHFCVARGVRHDLDELHRARNTYRKNHGAEIPSLQALANESYYELPYRDPECYHLECSGSGGSWVCRVARTDQIPGYYLMTSTGTIYFSEHHPATTQDVKLPQ